MKRFLILSVIVTVTLSATQANKLEKNVGKQVKNLQFSWDDCTPKSEDGLKGTAVIKTLQVSPDPIVIPGNVSVGFEVDANVNLTSPSQVSIPVPGLH